MDEVETEVLDFMDFPRQHWPNLTPPTLSNASTRSTAAPRSSAYFRMSTNITRLVRAILLEQNDEWADPAPLYDARYHG